MYTSKCLCLITLYENSIHLKRNKEEKETVCIVGIGTFCKYAPSTNVLLMY